MTSDAKIGLLLGLIFIFVVAFVINGLPNLKPQATRAEVSTNMVSATDRNIGIVDTAQMQADQDWRGLVNQQESQAETEEAVAQGPSSVLELPSQESELSETANYPEIRFQSALPKNLLDRVVAGFQTLREQTSTINMDVPTPVSSEQVAIQTMQPKPQESVSPSPEQTKPAATTRAKQPERTYVVGDGESLSTVAKKVYGPEEGNKIANVERIFQANRDILPSIHEVRSGQKLVIPPLPQSAPAANPNKPSDVLPRELFERVEALKRPVAPAPAANAEVRWYTVLEGDNLWRIASNQLGAGARYDEIAKLNADLLKDPSRVDPGTKIRLPLK